jgi:hypothetical protein
MEWFFIGALGYILYKYFIGDRDGKCPNCHSKIPKEAKVCKHCKFSIRKIRDDKAKKFQAENLAKIEAKKKAKTEELSPSNKPLEPNSSGDKQKEIVKPSEKE